MYLQKMSINPVGLFSALTTMMGEGAFLLQSLIWVWESGLQKVTPLKFPGDQLVLPDTARVPERCGVI